jgi:hypothetical protein
LYAERNPEPDSTPSPASGYDAAVGEDTVLRIERGHQFGGDFLGYFLQLQFAGDVGQRLWVHCFNDHGFLIVQVGSHDDITGQQQADLTPV